MNKTSEKETAMTTWVYKCKECGIAFAVEAPEGEIASPTTTCTQCGNTGAEKQFELSQPSGGCGCGGCC